MAWPGIGAISRRRRTVTREVAPLLRFWQVDYLADVWVNGVHVGQHEGGEDPFVCDVTDASSPVSPIVSPFAF